MQTNLPIDKKHRNELLHQKREECLVYDVRFETGEICKELLWVSNRLGKESVKKKVYILRVHLDWHLLIYLLIW